ncbi:sugar ABC transporter permease [Devosia sp. ZB163]|uniref:carbohydrate ABC transporter permease n=1 Tax=Devosia sp. ZB163 TaxID=3025938 RepID=UPI0023612F38|nr:sugar ABC transporter permease [Devosia sp. ZB163]MDC9824178.1 sugar ABC transporter permease [Devosia sp. ZB163]
MTQIAEPGERAAPGFAGTAAGRKPRTRRKFNIQSILGTTPMIATAIGVFVICIIFSIIWSFTSSKLFPNFNFVGLSQYERLWRTDRWIISVQNVFVYGVLSMIVGMVFGYLLAVFMDQRIRQEDLFRSIFLYPFAMSLVVTGLVWQWMFDPNLGIQSAVRQLGWTSFEFAPLVKQETALYGLVLGGLWNGVGVTMAIMLAGLRGVDAEIWKAAKVDGIPTWKTYLFIVLPMMKGAIATAFILSATGVVRVFDIVIAMTQGGPGVSTQMPAIYVIQHITDRANVGQGMAAATMMLVPVMVIISLQYLFQWNAKRKAART